MPSNEDILHRFDGETSRRSYSMVLAGNSPAEVAEYVGYREDRRAELVRELEREPMIWRH